LSGENNNALFLQLKQNAIIRIAGNIYIDDTLFDQNGRVPAALSEDATYSFSAPVTASNIDRNCAIVSVKPSMTLGDLANANVVQTPDAMTLINQIITAPSRNCSVMAVINETNNAYVLSGCISAKKAVEEFTLPVQNMRSYVGELLPQVLAQADITWSGQVLFDKAPTDAKMLALHQSAPLSVLITHMLKKSDNLYANALFKTVGAHYFHTMGNWLTGAAAVKAILWENNGVNLLSASLVDGAGLSRENVISPEQMLQVLSTVYYRPLIAGALIPALPIGGVDGTLKGRLTEDSYRHRVYAKTGTMNDVSSLSGYVKNSKNQVLAFSIFINGTPSHLGSYRALEDRICQLLIDSN
jgi:D-alanyl-D-alanine carboxypeptidase/D-alanyl-D-alanine-endopeptidase (penicillin-binding protein 4)